MGRQWRKSSSRQRARRRQPRSTSWQLWVVLAGIALVLVVLATSLVRGTGPYRSEYEGTVVSKRILDSPGRLDPRERRELTLRESEGGRLVVEVEARVYAAAEEGYFVRRTLEDGVEIRDRQGREVPLADGR